MGGTGNTGATMGPQTPGGGTVTPPGWATQASQAAPPTQDPKAGALGLQSGLLAAPQAVTSPAATSDWRSSLAGVWPEGRPLPEESDANNHGLGYTLPPKAKTDYMNAMATWAARAPTNAADLAAWQASKPVNTSTGGTGSDAYWGEPIQTGGFLRPASGTPQAPAQGSNPHTPPASRGMVMGPGGFMIPDVGYDWQQFIQPGDDNNHGWGYSLPPMAKTDYGWDMNNWFANAPPIGASSAEIAAFLAGVPKNPSNQSGGTGADANWGDRIYTGGTLRPPSGF